MDGRNVVIKKSSYEGAINEDTPDQTRQYDRSDVLKAFKESITKILNKDEQYSEKLKDFQSKRSAASVAVRQVLGRNALDGENVIIRKSSYQGATNEGTADQTRQYDRSDVLKAFKESITKIENLA